MAVAIDQEKLRRLRQKVAKLPLLPGVYLMRDAKGTIIYVGKAKLLKNRVGSYFRAVERHTEKVYRMVEHVEDFDFIVTGSEFEALVLECSLIKQHSPKYNILLKDDKGYSYIRVWPGDWPRITAEKQKLSDGSRYLGPYMSGRVVKQTVDEANRAFQLPTCRRRFPQDFGKERPCLNFYIKRCMGVCTGKIPQADYRDFVDQALGFIQSGAADSVKSLTERMNAAAEALDFEKAAYYRDRLKVLSQIGEHQTVVMTREKEVDCIGVLCSEKESCAAVIKFRENRLVDKEDFLVKDQPSPADFRRDFLLSYYYAGRHEIPKLIVVDGELEDRELIARLLGERLGAKVEVRVPERGALRQMAQMAHQNAAERLSLQSEASGRELAALAQLAELLGLAAPPRYIEAYDISNIGEQVIVGGMVVYEDGRPKKSCYRKFKIETTGGIDDYAAMTEMLSRRLRYLKENDGSDEAFSRRPDLILLDGGKGHLSVITRLMEEMGLVIPVFGMVKDSHHRTRAITSSGGEIAITSTRACFTFLSRLQDEVHRYTIGYSRKKHQKDSFRLELCAIPGIGRQKALALLGELGGIARVRQASPAQLEQVKGISPKLAQAVYEHFHPGENPPDALTSGGETG